MSKAMALRIKYRTTIDAGQIKRRLPLLTLSVHPANRGGIYPQGDDAKQFDFPSRNYILAHLGTGKKPPHKLSVA